MAIIWGVGSGAEGAQCPRRSLVQRLVPPKGPAEAAGYHCDAREFCSASLIPKFFPSMSITGMREEKGARHCTATLRGPF